MSFLEQIIGANNRQSGVFLQPQIRNRLGINRRRIRTCRCDRCIPTYMALVRPLLEYSNSVWDPYQKELINKIENIQKKAARFTTNTYDKTTSITQLIKDLNWDTLQNRRTANRLTILHKARQGHLALPGQWKIYFNHPSSNSNPVSYWVTWQTNRELYIHELAKLSSLFSAFRKCLKLQNWYQNVLLCLKNITSNVLFWKIIFFLTLQSTCIFRRHVGEDVNIP